MFIIFKKIDFNFLILLTILIYSTLFATRFFGTNDDMLMMLLSSGIYTGEASEYIVFQNILMGLFLKKLYLINNSINLYVIMLSLSQSISFIVLFNIFRQYLNKLSNFILFIIPIIYFIIEFNLYLQFTKVAFLSCIIGVIFLLDIFITPKVYI